MKNINYYLIINLLFLAGWIFPTSLASQGINNRPFFPQDSVWFKRIEPLGGIHHNIHPSDNALIDEKKQSHLLIGVPDTAIIIIHYILTDDSLEIIIKDRFTDSLITDYYEAGYFERSEIIQTEIQVSKNRVFIIVGFLSNYSDTATGEIFRYSYLHSYLITEDYNLKPFGKLSSISSLLDYKYAWGYSYYYSGGGFDQYTK